MKYLATFVHALGFTPDSLADAAGIDPERLAVVLNGGLEPTLHELRLIAAAMSITVSDLVASEEPERFNLLFRDTSEDAIAKDIATVQISRRVSMAIDVLGYSGKPHWLSAFETVENTYAEAMRLADLFRSVFCRDDLNRPFFDLPKILVADAGVLLFVAEKTGIDGASGIHHGWPFVVLSRRFAPRMLFTLAHELGHLVGHHKNDRPIFVDRKGSVGKALGRSGKSVEQFADAFATNLLLPADGVGLALRGIRKALKVRGGPIGDIEILHLAHFFGVSFQVAAIKCEQLGLLPEGGAASLYKHLVKHHRSPERRAREAGIPDRQPVEFAIPHEQLVTGTIKAVDRGDISLGVAAELLGVKMTDVLARHVEHIH